MLTFSAISRSNTASPYAASLRRISERLESGASMLPDTSTSSTVLPRSLALPSRERSMTFSSSDSHCGA